MTWSQDNVEETSPGLAFCVPSVKTKCIVQELSQDWTFTTTKSFVKIKFRFCLGSHGRLKGNYCSSHIKGLAKLILISGMGGMRMCDLSNNKQTILFMHLLTTSRYIFLYLPVSMAWASPIMTQTNLLADLWMACFQMLLHIVHSIWQVNSRM